RHLYRDADARSGRRHGSGPQVRARARPRQQGRVPRDHARADDRRPARRQGRSEGRRQDRRERPPARASRHARHAPRGVPRGRGRGSPERAMKLPQFFIDRPIFATVISTVIFIVGLIAAFRLPISEYPEVVPPSVIVSTQYPGANPKVIAETVASPLEQAINGVEHMLYMSSQSTADGNMTITVTFEIGTNIDVAQQLVQNRVTQATPKLPEDVRRIGITTVKSSPDLTMVVHLLSPQGRYNAVSLRNYAPLQVIDTLARLPGMGQVRVFGSGDYAMRVWLDPDRIASRNLTDGDGVSVH